MLIKLFYVVRQRETTFQFVSGPFNSKPAAANYIRENINAQLIGYYKVCSQEIELKAE